MGRIGVVGAGAASAVVSAVVEAAQAAAVGRGWCAAAFVGDEVVAATSVAGTSEGAGRSTVELEGRITTVRRVATYVALLRGIAPTNPKMRNAELAKVFEQLSFREVRTVISSGNVLFSTEERSKVKLESGIEAALREHLGAPCSTILRSRRQIEHIASLDIFDAYSDEPAARCNVTFLKRKPALSQAPPENEPGAGIVAVQDQAVFSVVDTTRSRTPDLMARLERAYGKEITTRTWKTVHRIAAAFDR